MSDTERSLRRLLNSNLVGIVSTDMGARGAASVTSCSDDIDGDDGVLDRLFRLRIEDLARHTRLADGEYVRRGEQRHDEGE